MYWHFETSRGMYFLLLFIVVVTLILMLGGR